MNQTAVQELKNRLTNAFSLSDQDKRSLDESLNSVPDGVPALVLFVLGVLAIYLISIGLFVVSIIIGIFIINDCGRKLTFTDRQLEILAKVIGERFYKNRLLRLHQQLPNLPLASLKSIDSHIVSHIVFIDGNNKFPFLLLGSSHRKRTSSIQSRAERLEEQVGLTQRSSWRVEEPKAATQLDYSNAYEICPGVLLKIVECRIECRCDFRIERNEMAPHQVGWLFRLAIDTVPEISMDDITVRQYGSTKEFLFRREYLDSGTISYVSSKRSNRNQLSRPESRSNIVNRNSSQPVTGVGNSDYYANNLAKAGSSNSSVNSPKQNVTSSSNSSTKKIIESGKGTNNKAAGTGSKTGISDGRSERGFKAKSISLSSIVGRTKVLISELIEARREVEFLAMKTVMQYEKAQGRKPYDVSKQNLGFDILSRDIQNQERKIEVKGFKTIGTVVLTENEKNIACNTDATYYLYVVENCSASGKKRIVIRQNIKLVELEEQPSKYFISTERLDRVAQYINLS